MSDRKLVDARTIHPRALSQLGEHGALAMLGVARDLRSGVIPPKEYAQDSYCGTACCIAGHTATRMGMDVMTFLFSIEWPSLIPGLINRNGTGLFGGDHPSDPQLAADAIERYIYDGSETPWTA